MVSELLNITDASIPMYESGPKLLYISKSSPTAAEDENIFTVISGTSSFGSFNSSAAGARTFPIISSPPEALNIPTAVISPIKVGSIPRVTSKPSFTPFIKSPNISVFLYTAAKITTKNTPGIMASETYSIIFPMFFPP